ncbi:MAG: filamentous hemagglutinin N-terminal domain-containing protein [Leptolyngbyaceae cyanobacterium CRU_2_3]|nr:filamentous hemagglutinin N-terminal domain-containing protein [Leptolyngbyaceae cyanobacterium CRU_2_3]
MSAKKIAIALLLQCWWQMGMTPAPAQIVPDRTLGNESSRSVPTTIRGLPADQIEGGAIRGANLFHSFREFNVGNGRGAYFANPANVQNILTRVTGGNPSAIRGTLGVLGNANLFLLNPNGILFGQNARLDLSGSFLSSTADGLLFGNGFEFSAANPQAPPLLTVNLPVGLRFRDNPGGMINRSRTSQEILGNPTPIGLAVNPGRSLAFIGGDINLANGSLTALQGNIQLGSVSSAGVVGLIPNATGSDFARFDYRNIAEFGNIGLSGNATVTTTGLGGGAIGIQGRQVSLRDRATITSRTIGNLNGQDITIRADQFRLSGRASVDTITTGSGRGGNLLLQADTVNLRGIGFAALLKNGINAALDGKINPADFAGAAGSGLISGSIGAGRGGNIIVDTRQLLLEEGAQIDSPNFRGGAGGDVVIRASDSVRVIGAGIFGVTLGESPGGQVTIDTNRLVVQDGGIISTSAFGEGDGRNLIINADTIQIAGTAPIDGTARSLIVTGTVAGGAGGDVMINTRRLIIGEGGAIGSSTLRDGSSGDVRINASESVELIGNPQGSEVPSGIAAASGESLFSSRLEDVEATGEAGNLTITTDRLTLQGGLGITANSRNSSKASGGNITITSNFLIAFPNSNSDITANARSAQGGRVTINVPNILGLAAISREQLRDRLNLTDAQFASLPENPTLRLPTNDIAAISQTAGANLQGTVTFNTTGIDPVQGVVELPQTVVDPNVLVADNACTQAQNSEFVITGRGGLPASPENLLSSQSPDYPWISPTAPLEPATAADPQATEAIAPAASSATIKPAQGWMINSTGKVTLTAGHPTLETTQRGVQQTSVCLPR